MKKLITNYTFNASAQTITFVDQASIDLESVLLITNVTSNVIVYNFANPAQGGSVAGNVLTLDYNTTSMSNSDALQIYYDDASTTPSSAENQVELQQLTNALYELINRLDFLPAVRGISADLRTSVVNTVNTTIQSGTVTTLSSLGPYNTNTMVKDLNNSLAISANINNIVT